MTELWLGSRAHLELEDEAKRFHPLETGGILVGYFSDHGTPVVYAVVGPGPGAVHRRLRFTPDHAWQCHQLDMLFEQSDGLWTYIGDWHTHPDGVPQMSWLDRRTLRSIAKHPDARTPRPVMLIGGGRGGDWRWLAHQYCSDRLLGLSATSDTLEVRIFEASSAVSSSGE